MAFRLSNDSPPALLHSACPAGAPLAARRAHARHGHPQRHAGLVRRRRAALRRRRAPSPTGSQMVADGADILDVGGESTRPGAEPLPADEELRRVLPVVERLARGSPRADLHRHLQGRGRARGGRRGATIINDISGLQYDDELAAVVAETGAALVLMHTRGRSRDDVSTRRSTTTWCGEVASELEAAIGAREPRPASPRESIILDPGLRLRQAGRAHLGMRLPASTAGGARPADPVGPSRKSFLTRPLGERRRPRTATGAPRRRSTASVLWRRAHRPRPRRARDVRRRARRRSDSCRRRFASTERHARAVISGSRLVR